MSKKQAFALMLLFLFSMISLDSVPAFSEDSGPDVKKESRSLVDINLHFLRQKKTVDEWGRDPFLLPPVTKNGLVVDKEKRFWLNAIIYKNGSGAAIINNQITRRGDHIGGMAVHDIQPDRVILKNGPDILELRVDPITMK